jgi:hypothetical protein
MLDYRRFVNGGSTALAVLVPSKPRPDLLQLVKPLPSGHTAAMFSAATSS